MTLRETIVTDFDPASHYGDVAALSFMNGNKVLAVLTGEPAEYVHRLQALCEQMREGLRKYACEAAYEGCGFWDGIQRPWVLADAGEDAREALAAYEKEMGE